APGPASGSGSLVRDAGRIVMAGFRGTTVEETGRFADDLRSGRVGGVVLFDEDRAPDPRPHRNVVSPEQVRALVVGLRALGPEPILVAVDQEGGRVARFTERHGFPATPSARELGRSGDPGRTAGAAEVTASTLAALGVDLNLAPVVDLDRNPAGPAIGAAGRSYSPDPAVVTAHARAFVLAHRRRGVATVLKHFPGHGSAAEDSHLSMADVTSTWSPDELAPYRSLIAEGLADAVMTAHVFHRDLDPDWPATLSPAVVDGLLRRDLGFGGVVLTDDLQMGAIAGGHGLHTAVRQALLAGADILLFANNSPGAYDEEAVPRAVAAVLDVVARGEVPAQRVAEAASRVRRLAARP
ncbi:MAG: glycoside hydrolase family 3 N-terminal domain-containing protein, partial [Actinomycetota bacterium]